MTVWTIYKSAQLQHNKQHFRKHKTQPKLIMSKILFAVCSRLTVT